MEGGRSQRSHGSRASGHIFQRPKQQPWESRGQGRRTRGQRRSEVNKSTVQEAIPDEAMLDWMAMMTQGLHQTMGQGRKNSGAAFDTWLSPAEHAIAKTLMATHIDFQAQVETRREEIRAARRSSLADLAGPPPLGKTAPSMFVSLIHELKQSNVGTAAQERIAAVWTEVTARARPISPRTSPIARSVQ